jgi:hypothetical protein
MKRTVLKTPAAAGLATRGRRDTEAWRSVARQLNIHPQ